MGKIAFVKGRMSSGYAQLMNIDGEKIDFSYMPRGKKTPKFERMKRIVARNSILIGMQFISNL